MKNKNILITGSEGLIWKNLTNFLKKKDHNILRLDIAKNVRDKNYFRCDITNENQVKKTINEISKNIKIDILINNAAFNPKHNSKTYKFVNYDLKKWRKNIEVDLIGSFLVTKYVSRMFEKYKKGLILNISSIYGIIAPDQNIYNHKKSTKFLGFKPIEYSIAKAGLIGFTKSLASYYSGTNIKVASLSLGGIYTPDMNKKFVKNYSNKTIEKRLANINDYSEFINFLCEGKMKYFSGTNFVLDGGATSIL